MAKTFNTQGVVLHRGDYLENDRIFVLYTQDYGKIEVIAKGTKKILSKLNPHLEPFNEVKIMVAKGKGYDKLGNALSVNNFSEIRNSNDIRLFVGVNLILEVTEKLLQHNFPDENIYNNLIQSLKFINTRSDEVNSLSESLFCANIYILKFLDILGYRPQLSRCGNCNKGVLFPKSTFDFLRGSLICENCKDITLIHEHYDITDSVIKILNIILNESYTSLMNYKFNPDDVNEFNIIVTKLLEYQYDKKINSLDFLKYLIKDNK